MIEGATGTVLPDALPGTFFFFFAFTLMVVYGPSRQSHFIVEESRFIATCHFFSHIHMVAGMYGLVSLSICPSSSVAASPPGMVP